MVLNLSKRKQEKREKKKKLKRGNGKGLVTNKPLTVLNKYLIGRQICLDEMGTGKSIEQSGFC